MTQPTPDLSALLDDLEKLVEGRPDDTRAVLMRGELRTLLALSRWALQSKEVLDYQRKIRGCSGCDGEEEEHSDICETLSRFPSL